ncbi:MAG TPA: gamma-glutamylcyclotransferase family protein [Actinomycetota bacterium]|nr:gamma-glutamylcyclotransferase family protein [Actinomycetota bacterium]
MRYFAYGVHMDPRAMAEACPGAPAGKVGRLDGYRLGFTVYSERWEGGAANIEADPDAHVWGVVWEVPEECIRALDTYEGHPTFYRQEDVTVATGDRTVDCVTYRVAHQTGFVRPSDAYVNVLRAAMRQQGLPPEALDILEAAARPPGPRIRS